MALKLVDLFEIKFIGGHNQKALEKFENIETHSILYLDEKLRKQFVLLVSTYHNNIFVVNLFKKFYDANKNWNMKRVQYMNTICLSSTTENTYKWKDLENSDFIKSIKLCESYFVLDDSYNRSILMDDYDFYINLKNQYNNLTADLEDEISKKLWGRTYHIESIIWQVFLSNFIMMLYGSGINEIYFRSKDFVQKKLIELYYPNYNDDSVIYNKFIENRMGVCNNCEDMIDLKKGEMWHNSDYGDLCNYCFKEKRYRETSRLAYLRRQIKLAGNKEIFKINLEKTRKYLEENDIIKLDDKKKYELMRKINENMLSINERPIKECSVCLEEMTEDIYAGGCGHCLHEICYFKLNSNKCPLCRKNTTFKKLHL